MLGKLAPDLAITCSDLWLDRLGGDQGMGEWAVESMQRGVQGADVVVAVVSQAYIQSKNCGVEMGFAAETGTTVLPIVLGVPFSEWPPKQVGQTPMKGQFATASGDLKIFVDMSDPSQFHTKLQRELLPRLKGTAVSSAATSTRLAADQLADSLASDSFAADEEQLRGAVATAKVTRPGSKRNAKVSPAQTGPAPAAPAGISAADTQALRDRFGPKVDSGEIAIKGHCPNCGTVVTDRDHREFYDGKYWLKKCHEEKFGNR